MKNNNKNQLHYRLRGMLCGVTVLAGNCLPVEAVDKSIQYTINVTINEGTCQVSTMPSRLTLTPVERKDLKTGKVVSIQGFYVNVGSCTGTAAEGHKPVLSVSGVTLGSSSTEPGYYLFNTGGGDSTAKGFGIVLSTSSPDSWNTTDYVHNGMDIPLQPSFTGGQFAGVSKQVFAGVGCGDAVACSLDDADHMPGSIAANITFTFNYK